MYNIYIDEKGPQESFKKTNPFDKKNKIAYGSDNMHVFVANAIRIPKYLVSDIQTKYLNIEKEYLKTRNFKEGTELKGNKILNKNFKYGVSSLKKNELIFYTKLFNILNEYKVDNLLFSISKMALIIDSRLNNWILDTSTKTKTSAVLLKYVITKYASIEASEEVIKSLFDKNSTNVNEVLQNIKRDLISIIDKNIDNSRMTTQIKSYKEIIQLINDTEHIKIKEPDIKATFNWNKVTFKIDLWLLENKKSSGENRKDMNLILDEGIPKEYFEEFQFKSIHENAKSEECFGVRISDVLVSLAGSYISILSADSNYDFNNPTKPKRVPPFYFVLNEDQYNLIKKMTSFFFQKNKDGDKKYGYNVDTYFDEGVLFESFLKYINEYKSFVTYTEINSKQHAELHWKLLARMMKDRSEQARFFEGETIKMFDSLKIAIQKGIFHPL